MKKLVKQQLRWARGSQYNTLRMLPWMLGHAPVLAVFFLTDILLPFLLLGTILGWVYRSVTGTGTNLYEADPRHVHGAERLVLGGRADDRVVRAVDVHPADPAPAREAVGLPPAAHLHHRLDVLPHADPHPRLLPHGARQRLGHPLRRVRRRSGERGPDGRARSPPAAARPSTSSTAPTTATPCRPRSADAARPQAAPAPTPARRRLNPLAAVPYGIALALLALEALAYV